MRLLRRRFLKLGLLSSVVSQIPLGRKAKADFSFRSRFDYSILQGATDEASTQFSILHDRNNDLWIYAKNESGQVIYPDKIETVTHGDHSQKIDKVYFSDLSLNERYELILADQAHKILDRRFFRTLDLNKENLRFAIASCMDDSKHEPKIWQDMMTNSPDLILFVGDSVYADRNRGEESSRAAARPKQLWRRFCEARKTLEIYNSETLVPVLATWDDHDYGQNDTGSSYPYIKESQKNFLTFFAQEESHCQGLNKGPGVSSALVCKNQMFLLLDDRSFRDKNGKNKPNGHWGDEQMSWIMSLVEDFDGFVWIANGSQIFPSMMFKESVSKEHPVQLRSFLKKFKEKNVRAAFISGDVHFTEISEIEEEHLGYVTYELTSSSIHSTTFPGILTIVSNWRRVAATDKRNYIMVDSHFENHQLNMKVISRSASGQINFERNYLV